MKSVQTSITSEMDENAMAMELLVFLHDLATLARERSPGIAEMADGFEKEISDAHGMWVKDKPTLRLVHNADA